jgi:hypothetical protein
MKRGLWDLLMGKRNNRCRPIRTRPGKRLELETLEDRLTPSSIQAVSDGFLTLSHSDEAAISPDGRYVAFQGVDGLVPGDAHDYFTDIYVRDTHLGTTTLVSAASDGTLSNDKCGYPSVAVDNNGHVLVAFTSWATNLVPGDTNARADVFVKDMSDGSITRVSTDSERCREAVDGEHWPPPLDDRIAWTGEWEAMTACRKFGWYRSDLVRECEHCEPDDPGATEDIRRFGRECEWDRNSKCHIRTNLSEALGELDRFGIVIDQGNYANCTEAIAGVSCMALMRLEQRDEVHGYGFYTAQDKRKRQWGVPFNLYFGQPRCDEYGHYGFPPKEIGKQISDALSRHDVAHRWSGREKQPIQVLTSSIVTLP